MIILLVNVEKVSFKNADNIVYEPCYYQISVGQQIFYDQVLLISLFEEKARSLFESVKRFVFNTVRNHLFGLRGSQSIQWLTIKDRPLILLRTANHLIALSTAHPPKDPQFTGDAIDSPPNTIVGTSDCKLKLDTDDGLKTTVSASNRE
jgi:hypothetical protein